MVTFVLLLVGFILFALAFVLAAIGIPSTRVNLVAAGLACWILTALIGAWP